MKTIKSRISWPSHGLRSNPFDQKHGALRHSGLGSHTISSHEITERLRRFDHFQNMVGTNQNGGVIKKDNAARTYENINSKSRGSLPTHGLRALTFSLKNTDSYDTAGLGATRCHSNIHVHLCTGPH